MNGNYTATIVKEDAYGMHQLSVSALLASEGKLFLTDNITGESVGEIIRNMIYLADNDIPITLYIDSVGGEVRSGLALVDVIEMIGKKVSLDVVCIGKAYSMAAVILSAPEKGHRFLLPHAEVMIHEPLIPHGAGGSASSVKSTADSLMATRDLISKVLARHTEKSVKEINKAIGYDHFFNSNQAIEFGLADAIVETI